MKILTLLLLTSTSISLGYDGDLHMADDQYSLKRQALDQLEQSIADKTIADLGFEKRTGKDIERDFYEGVLSPENTDVTNSMEGGPSYEEVAPFQAMYNKEFAPGDAAYKEAADWSMWKRGQNDQGPGTKGYVKEDPIEQARMFGKLLQQNLKSNADK